MLPPLFGVDGAHSWLTSARLGGASSSLMALTQGPRGSVNTGAGGLASMAEFPAMVFENLVPCEFVWRHGGREVFLESSFDGWSQRHSLTEGGAEGTVTATEDAAGAFSMVRLLPPGVYQYKFIVDGQWKVSQDLPQMHDAEGNLNNVIEVDAAAAGGGAGSGAPVARTVLSSSPPESYNSPMPRPEDFAKEPPVMPPQLKLSLLNLPKKAATQSTTHAPPSLPRPQHVTLGHYYRLSKRGHGGADVYGTTHRYRNKFVSVVYYAPSEHLAHTQMAQAQAQMQMAQVQAQMQMQAQAQAVLQQARAHAQQGAAAGAMPPAAAAAQAVLHAQQAAMQAAMQPPQQGPQ